MMKFNLQRLGGGTVEFESNSVLEFPAGLPGFETCKRFKLFHEEGKPTVFYLQSLDNPAVLFSLGDPGLLSLSYEVTLSDAEQALLKVTPGDELLLEVIVYKEGNKPDFVKVNMLAPIILNITKRLGLQKILQNLDTQLAIKAS
jgi:flagellar assembly factor FliW